MYLDYPPFYDRLYSFPNFDSPQASWGVFCLSPDVSEKQCCRKYSNLVLYDESQLLKGASRCSFPLFLACGSRGISVSSLKMSCRRILGRVGEELPMMRLA